MSKLQSPERVAPSSVATSIDTCRGRRSSRRPGGGGLDDRRPRHDCFARRTTVRRAAFVRKTRMTAVARVAREQRLKRGDYEET